MKKIVIFFSVLLLACGAASCQKADSERPWGSAVIYMPQAGYTPYTVPNDGTAQQSNKNYRIDTQAGKVHIFLGIYRGWPSCRPIRLASPWAALPWTGLCCCRAGHTRCLPR